MHFSSKYKSVKIDQNNWVPHKTWNWSYRLFRKYPNPSLDCPFSVVWDRSRSIMSLTVNIMSFLIVDFHPSLITNTLLRTVHLIPFWSTTHFNSHELSTFLTVYFLLDPSDSHFFFISRPPTFNPEDHPIRAFIPYRFRPKDHQLCEFRSTFADRWLLVIIGPVQTPCTVSITRVACF